MHHIFNIEDSTAESVHQHDTTGLANGQGRNEASVRTKIAVQSVQYPNGRTKLPPGVHCIFDMDEDTLLAESVHRLPLHQTGYQPKAETKPLGALKNAVQKFLEKRQYRCTGCSRIKVKLSYIDY